MKRFAFSLQRVLEFRRQIEERERGLLESLGTRRRRLLEQAAQHEEESRRARAEPVQRSFLAGLDLRYAYQYAQALGRARKEALAEAERVDQQRQQQLGVVIEARRNTRLLEMLRSKRLRRRLRLADREQEAIAGELHLAKLRRDLSTPSLQAPQKNSSRPWPAR